MRYETAADFRTALEQRLANQSSATGVAVDRLRRLAVFERILARLTATDPGMWVLKGGVALEIRWPKRARTTKDLDLATRLQPVDGSDLHEHLVDVLATDPDEDAFRFVVAPPKPLQNDEAGRPGWRFPVQARLAGREFTSISLDVVQRVAEIAATERMAAPNSFAFADIPDRVVELVSAVQHFAEKLHALTRDYGRENTRVRDLVDLTLLIERATLPHAETLAAVRNVFEIRGTHDVPRAIPDPPEPWVDRYTRLALALDIQAKSAPEAMVLLREFWARALATAEAD